MNWILYMLRVASHSTRIPLPFTAFIRFLQTFGLFYLPLHVLYLLCYWISECLMIYQKSYEVFCFGSFCSCLLTCLEWSVDRLPDMWSPMLAMAYHPSPSPVWIVRRVCAQKCYSLQCFQPLWMDVGEELHLWTWPVTRMALACISPGLSSAFCLHIEFPVSHRYVLSLWKASVAFWFPIYLPEFQAVLPGIASRTNGARLALFLTTPYFVKSTIGHSFSPPNPLQQQIFWRSWPALTW